MILKRGVTGNWYLRVNRIDRESLHFLAFILLPCPLFFVLYFSLSTFTFLYSLSPSHFSRLKSRIWHLYLFDDFKKCNFLAIQRELQWNFRGSY